MDAIAPAVDGKFMSAFVRGQKPRSSWCTPARERNSARSKIPYLRWLLRAIYWIDLVVFLGFGVYVFSQWQWNVRYLVGIGIAVASFALWMVARVQLGKSFSVRAQARALVTTGLYSKFRHPIYLFGELAFAGLFLAWGELIPALAYFVLICPAQIVRSRKEEAVLEEAFGEEYRQYKASTWF